MRPRQDSKSLESPVIKEGWREKRIMTEEEVIKEKKSVANDKYLTYLMREGLTQNIIDTYVKSTKNRQ